MEEKLQEIKMEIRLENFSYKSWEIFLMKRMTEEKGEMKVYHYCEAKRHSQVLQSTNEHKQIVSLDGIRKAIDDIEFWEQVSMIKECRA